ncbi:hypothetical protein SERLA73DRAFT_128582 [Serpula lacrymans var. lacrymans S7.3]|uniref:Uncharacterized protein n=1 Tax=Serpula lacrymans var. lacrymans (strain S7.3) TaxID=936435 RepID=F8PHT1_SERL3|nr:hypothetical protein SERLA73DRAFT_128582 [Serpula lacrymans var. lacrymans S7.3]
MIHSLVVSETEGDVEGEITSARLNQWFAFSCVFDGEELPTLSRYPIGRMLIVQVLSLTH